MDTNLCESILHTQSGCKTRLPARNLPCPSVPVETSKLRLIRIVPSRTSVSFLPTIERSSTSSACIMTSPFVILTLRESHLEDGIGESMRGKSMSPT